MIKIDYIHWNITKSYCIWLDRFHSQICVHFKPQTIWKFPNSSSSSLLAGKTWGHFWGGNRRLYKFCLLGNRYSYCALTFRCSVSVFEYFRAVSFFSLKSLRYSKDWHRRLANGKGQLIYQDNRLWPHCIDKVHIEPEYTSDSCEQTMA